MDFSKMFKSLLDNIGPILKFLIDNIGVVLGIGMGVLGILLLKQCSELESLKDEISAIEYVVEREEVRFNHNIQSLEDSIVTLNDRVTHHKSIMILTDKDKRYLSSELERVKSELERVANRKIGRGSDITEVYRSDISVNSSYFSDSLTIKSYGDTIKFNVIDSNNLYTHKSTFQLTKIVDSTNITLHPLYHNMDGIIRSDFKLDFSFELAQVKLSDDSYRVMLRFKDRHGDYLTDDQLSVLSLEGSRFIDIESPFTREVKVIRETINDSRFVVSAGVMYGIFNSPDGVQSNVGLGIMVGYRLF